jgi:hypothetical protein
VQYALPWVIMTEILEAMLARIALKPLDHVTDGRIGNGSEPLVAASCLHVMVRARDDLLRAGNLTAGIHQVVKGMPGTFMQKQVIHEGEILALDLRNLMFVPDLVRECLRMFSPGCHCRSYLIISLAFEGTSGVGHVRGMPDITIPLLLGPL